MFNRIKNIFQKTPAEALLAAARDGDTSKVIELLATGLTPEQVNHQDKYGNTALIEAARLGLTEIVTALLAVSGINVNLASSLSYSALILAAENGHTDVVITLLARGSTAEQINHPNQYGSTALVRAAARGHIDVVSALLTTRSYAEQINHQDRDGNTALIKAAENGHIDVVRALLDTSLVEQVNHPNRYGNTALFEAAYHGHLDVVSTLLAVPSINVNLSNSSGASALIIAAQQRHTEIAKVLLAVPGINVNLTNNSGASALIIPAQEGHTEIVKALLTAPGIDVNLQTQVGLTALLWAAQNGHIEVLMALLAVPNINVNATDQDDDTALIKAAGHGHIEVVRALLTVPEINFNLTNQRGDTALNSAKKKGHRVIQDMLQLHAFAATNHQTKGTVLYAALASANHIHKKVVQPVLTLLLCLNRLEDEKMARDTAALHSSAAQQNTTIAEQPDGEGVKDIALVILYMMQATGWVSSHQPKTSTWGPTLGFIHYDYLMNTARKVRANAILGGHLNDSNQADSHGKQACQNAMDCGSGPKMIVHLIDAIAVGTTNRDGRLQSLNMMLKACPATWKHELRERLTKSGQKDNLVTIAATLPQSHNSFFKRDPYPHIAAFVRDYVQPKTTSSLKGKHRRMG